MTPERGVFCYTKFMIVEWAVKKKLFRNENHAIWFLLSMWILVVSIAHFFYPAHHIVFLVPVLLHGIALIQAIHATATKHASVTLSKDCIWFNAIMILVYILIYFLV